MYMHPELARQLAQAQIEEARSRTQRASALRAARLDRRTEADLVAARRGTWAAAMPATVRSWHVRRAGPRASAPPTTNC
jgi:anaerobic selenocysteine-containing dehydrogenase